MASKRSTTVLSMEYMNHGGWTCARVEHWNAFAKIRQDLFGWADIIAYHPQKGIALIQTTGATHFSHRKVKMLASPHLAGWKRAGGHIWLHEWSDKGLREEML